MKGSSHYDHCNRRDIRRKFSFTGRINRVNIYMAQDSPDFSEPEKIPCLVELGWSLPYKYYSILLNIVLKEEYMTSAIFPLYIHLCGLLYMAGQIRILKHFVSAIDKLFFLHLFHNKDC